MQLKEQWIREGFSSYYVVDKEQKLTYEKNILRCHTLRCLLPCEFRLQDEKEYYYYETGIYTTLKERINMIDPKLFFANLIESFEETESYLLNLDHLKQYFRPVSGFSGGMYRGYFSRRQEESQILL